MGRTNPTYRDQLSQLETDWDSFRRGLRASEQAAFDQLFEHGRAYAHAASYCNHTDPERAFLLSILLAHQRTIRELEAELDTLRGTGDDTSPDSDAHEGANSEHAVQD